MTTVTFDTARLAERLRAAGFPPEQAEAVMRAIAEAQDELVTRRDLQIELAPLIRRLDVLTYAVGVNTLLSVGILTKLLIG